MNYEAQGIAPLVSESPFMSWLYDIFSVYTFSVLLGVFEIAAAVLDRRQAVVAQGVDLGSVLAIAAVRRDDQLPVHHPGVFDESRVASRAVADGGFLMKDIALLGISLWTLADALRATRSSLAGSSQAHAT